MLKILSKATSESQLQPTLTERIREKPQDHRDTLLGRGPEHGLPLPGWGSAPCIAVTSKTFTVGSCLVKYSYISALVTPCWEDKITDERWIWI